MKKFFGKKRTAALAVVAVLAVAAGAIAFFTSTGSGTGSGSVGATNPWTVTPATHGGDTDLYPGSGLQTFGGTVTNASVGHQNLAQVLATVAAPTVASGAPVVAGHPCSAGDFKLTAPVGSNWLVAADGQTATYAVGTDLAGTGPGPAGSVTWTDLGLTMVDAAYNQDNCQLATPHITFDAS